MTRSEDYKEFDTSSIISRDTVSLGKLTLRKRDLLLGGIAVIALVIAIILAIVLAVEAGKSKGSCPIAAASTSEQKGARNTSEPGQSAVSCPPSVTAAPSPTGKNGVTDLHRTNDPTTKIPLTAPPKTNAPTTKIPLTAPPKTNTPTTKIPLTAPPKTNTPTTKIPYTVPPKTNAPTTKPPLTVPPKTNPTLSSRKIRTTDPPKKYRDRLSDQEDICISPICLKTASYEKYIMDEAANPCHDFYKFACGGYASLYTPSPLVPEPSPFNQIEVENTQKLLYLLSYQPERNEEQSYERKLRQFLKSCNNHFDKMQLRGQPLLTQVIQPFGGWYVLQDNWDPSTFNLHKQLKIVHTTFWTPAFYSLRLSTDFTDWNKKVLEIDFGGLGLSYLDYIYVIEGNNVHTVYTDYMKQVARMLCRDANVTVNETRIKQFADDAISMELELANLLYQTYPQPSPHEDANRMSLGTINQLVNNTIDFVDYFKSQFPAVASMFSTDTKVAVLRQQFFHILGPNLQTWMSTNEGKRKIHNYLVWQLINMYVDDLSWDYVHAKRQFLSTMYGAKDTSSGSGNCFQVASKNMRDAMGAVFVKNYVNNNDKQEATNILEQIKEQIYAAIRNFSWMSSDNQESAITKIKNALYKIGYPEFMVNDTYMDSLYSILTVTEADYFGNVISLNLAARQKFSDLIAHPNSKTIWAYPVYGARVEYYDPWNELIMTAGMIQNPLFAHNGPAYYNFGGIGTILARHLIHAVDELGSVHKLDKSNPGVWWSQSTIQHFNDIKQCAIDAQKDTTIGPFMIAEGYPYTPNHTYIASAYVPELLAEASGLKLSYKAYRAKMASAGTEKIPAGFPNYSLNKLFFVAFAQAHCDNYDGLTKARKSIQTDPPSDYKVNLAVSQLQEFREAFGCSVGDPMAPAKTCTLF